MGSESFTWEIVKESESAVETGILSAINLYPNPFDQEVLIVHAEDCRLQVFNLEGVQVFTQQLTQTREAVRFDELPSGIYFFRLEKDGQTVSFTAIKK